MNHEAPWSRRSRRRDACLDYTVDVISRQREFRHLTPAAIRSYLLFLADTDHYVARVARKGVVRVWGYNGRFVHSVYAGYDAATSQGRDGYNDGLLFDTGNAEDRLAWRLGTSCEFCGEFLGRRRRSSYYAPDTLCALCLKHKQRDQKKWWAKHNCNAPADWLLLKAIERIGKSRRKAEQAKRPA